MIMVLLALFTDTQTDTHTDKYKLKSSVFSLRTVTNSFTLQACNYLSPHPLPLLLLSLYTMLRSNQGFTISVLFSCL